MIRRIRRVERPSLSLRAAIMLTSAALRRARCLRTPRISSRRACCSTTCSSSSRCFPRRRDAGITGLREVSRAKRRAESRRSARASRRVSEGARPSSRDGRAFRRSRCACLYAACTGQCRGSCSARDRRLARRIVCLRTGMAVRMFASRSASTRRARSDDRFHWDESAAAEQLQCALPVTRAAVLYVFRTLVEDEIPMNAGCLRPLRIIVPAGSMLNPTYPAAVVAGNVETSQVVTDCLYGALGVLAASQGTMNNFTFGDGEHQYYETIAGGAGAGPTSMAPTPCRHI